MHENQQVVLVQLQLVANHVDLLQIRIVNMQIRCGRVSIKEHILREMNKQKLEIDDRSVHNIELKIENVNKRLGAVFCRKIQDNSIRVYYLHLTTIIPAFYLNRFNRVKVKVVKHQLAEFFVNSNVAVVRDFAESEKVLFGFE
jgi:hypothetical protein